MFGSLGGPELVLILVIALIVFGPRRLPDIGKSVGKMLVEFRRALNDFKRTIEEEVELEKRSLNAPSGSPTITTAPEPVGRTAAAPSSAAPASAEAPAPQADEARPQPPGSVAQASAAATPSEPA